MLVKTKAIVLHSIKLGESKTIVDMLTERQGRVSFVCRIASSGKAKIKKQFFQPLTLLELEYDSRPGRTLRHIGDIRILTPFRTLPFDAFKLSIALFLAEFLYYSTREEQENEPLFAYVENSILWLDGAERAYANFHLVFMMRLSRFIGFFPNLDDYRPGDYFDLREGFFSVHPPLHTDFLQPAESATLRQFKRMNYETMRFFRLSRDERNRCAEVVMTYYRLHIPGFPELKSFQVVKELFV